MQVTVIGTGYVGSVTGACLAYLGHHVTCVDTDVAKIAKWKLGQSPIYEPYLDELIALAGTIGSIQFTTELADAARERGWSYIGISDHSESAFYAGGMKPDKLARQQDEIDEVNSRTTGFQILKGIEADILADGRIDYPDEILDTFDYVIGSIHSRFNMGGAAMTERVLKAMDDPRLTILGHPTGRLLLTRAPYEIDLEAVIEKAADNRVAIELNADPHRLDLDWRYCRTARELGVKIEIGPDAHSENGLDNTWIGVGMARKGWLEATDVLNTRDADGIIAFARARKSA